jgi:hypothetical protein
MLDNSIEELPIIDTDLLYDIYQFKHLPGVGDRQSSRVADKLVKHLLSFLPRLPIVEAQMSLEGFNLREKELLRCVFASISGSSEFRVEWKPKYGCAILMETVEDRVNLVSSTSYIRCY